MSGPPYNRIRLWITQQPFHRLLLYWAIIYVSLGILLALVYRALPGEVVSGGTGSPKTFIDFLHFSLTTQATVGYGDFYPVSQLARLIAAAQALLGTTLNAIILGVTTYKFIKHTSPVAFPSVLVYDPERHTFWFRFINWDADDVREVKLLVTAFQPNPRFEGAYDTVVSTVDIDYSEARWVPSVHLFSLRTKSNKGEHKHEIGGAENREEHLQISPLNVSEGTIIRLDLSGYFHTTGDAFFINKDYHLSDISCGQYEGVDNVALLSLPKKERVKHINQRFNNIVGTSNETCKRCTFHNKCLFNVALRLRSKSG